jgi:hypothetical protein
MDQAVRGATVAEDEADLAAENRRLRGHLAVFLDKHFPKMVSDTTRLLIMAYIFIFRPVSFYPHSLYYAWTRHLKTFQPR